MRADQREVRLDRQCEQELRAVDLDLALALGGCRADARGCQHAAQAMAAGADALGQGSLRAQLDADLARDHLPLRLGIQADVRRHELLDQLRFDQAGDAETGTPGVVGDDRQVLAALAHELGDQPMRRADAHEAADHERRAVGDLLHRGRDRYCFVHVRSPLSG